MKIEWHKVTPLSKIIALALFVALPFIGFWLGSRYAEMNALIAPNGSKGGATAAGAFPLSVVSIHDTSAPLYTLSIEYPQFPQAPAEFNNAIKTYVDSSLASFKQAVNDNWAARKATMPPGTPPEASSQYFYFGVTWEQAQLNSHYISIVVRRSSYEGGANGSEDLMTFSYDLSKHKPVALADLFTDKAGYLQTLSEASREQLTGTLDTMTEGHAPTDMINEGTSPTVDNFKSFTFTDDAIKIYFKKYQVAPGAAGEQSVVIGRNGL